MIKGPLGMPRHLPFGVQEADLTTTSEAQRVAAPERARIWKIKNPSVINPMSKAPVAYKVRCAASTACESFMRLLQLRDFVTGLFNESADHRVMGCTCCAS